MRKKLKFTETWGNKIFSRSFTTFRGQDPVYHVGETYDVVLLQDDVEVKNLGPHLVVQIEFKRICDIAASEIIQDMGRRKSLPDPRMAFFYFMKKLYADRPWWKEEKTILQKLYLEKLEVEIHEQKSIIEFGESEKKE
jgi:hypothetical protein